MTEFIADHLACRCGCCAEERECLQTRKPAPEGSRFARVRIPVQQNRAEFCYLHSNGSSLCSCPVRGCTFRGPHCPVHDTESLSRAHHAAVGFMANRWTTGADRDCELDLAADVRDARERFRQTVKDRWAKKPNNKFVGTKTATSSRSELDQEDVVPDELDYLLRVLLADAVVAS